VTEKRPDDRHEREMLEAFKKAMATRSAREAALTAIRLGDLYLESDSYTDALEYFVQAEVGELGAKLSDEEAAGLYVRIARCHLGLGNYREARAYCAQLDDLDIEDEECTVWAEANVVLARIEIESGRYDEALRAAEKAYDVLRVHPDSPHLAEAGKALGIANAELGNIAAARDYFTDYLVTQKRLGDQAGLAMAYNNLGILAKRCGDLDGALDYLTRALEIDRKLGRSAAVADRLANIGMILHRLSRWAEAEEKLIEARDVYSRIGATRGLVAAQSALGNIYRVRREWVRARELFEEALSTSQERGYLRAEALALEYLGDLELDQGRTEDALGTLSRALGCAYRLASESDVVGEVLRRRAEALFALGRLDEAERDCSDGIRLSRDIDDCYEEGALLRVLASICYAKGEQAPAEVLVARAEEILRGVGESFELARTELADGIGLRDTLAAAELPLDRIEARFSAAEAIFTRIGLPHWVARCQLERGKALHKGGQRDRARSWFDSARLKYEVAQDAQGLAEVDAHLRDLDSELADAGISRQSRYWTIAEGYRFLEMNEPRADDVHALAAEIAGALSADRLVLFLLEDTDAGAVVATSIDHSSGGLSVVTRFVKAALASRAWTRPLVVSEGRSASPGVPKGIGALALIPAEVGFERKKVYLLYVDRSSDGRPVAFTQSDVEFIGAAARMLGLAHSRSDDAREWEARAASGERDSTAPATPGLVTRDPEMLRVLATVERLKESQIPVLIDGESGVGKDLIARAIHEGGRSKRGRFVALNAAAIPRTLQESELFGHVKGAFTDASRDREGLVQAADGGTLFLDEIGEMSPELQVKLLRFLQNGEYRRVGDSVTRTSDARVISASNKDLREEVEKGTFRRDLFYRLCAVVLQVPPLRERPLDIPLLMDHFLQVYSEREGKHVGGFSPEVRDLFMRYDWRGNNVRELENEVRRGVALSADGEVIGIDKLRPELRERCQSFVRTAESRDGTLKGEVESLEKNRILEALQRTGWNKQKAAEILGMSRPNLHAKMRKYSL
jgi:DNA-binding NtrC family response regulator/tetratricopeptide (TPR) repeat protein